MKQHRVITEGPNKYPNGYTYWDVKDMAQFYLYLGTFTGSNKEGWTPGGCKKPSKNQKDCVQRILDSRLKEAKKEVQRIQKLIEDWRDNGK